MQFAKVRRHLGRLGRFLRRPAADKWLIMQAFVLLGHSRFLIKRRGLKAVQAGLGQQMIESTTDISTQAAAEAERIAWAIAGVRIYTPWTSNCFPQAVAAMRLLHNKQIDATVYFGATRDTDRTDAEPNATLAAHAWVRAGHEFTTGGDLRELYTAILWFGQHSGKRT